MIRVIVFDSSQYQEYAELSQQYKNYLEKWIPNIEFDYPKQEMKVNDITITPEI